ncbi:hypothetical protein F2K82_17750 [Vibrio cholerae]|uniref:hypothetical protein n=1 Tax=Vibrio cholerae TaxID=666 RepID=UPI0011D41AC8|nr:hypothetical protein [Vibrio cholerae]EGQ9631933.1 hypothetical protein [Vibrio cholerae]EGQ9639225.1 hypothetical protein [Vibrio cholerae]EKF9186638.1 hypothetical protein [Vibrio cholerae]ELF1354400.1 hypothetical protein [Vibrio cholerae]TXY50106.1 hypothetical protein FXE77_09885 [Vibrio cholerae]
MEKSEKTAVEKVLLSVISLVGTIILLPFIVLVVLALGYLFALFDLLGSGNASLPEEIKSLILTIWQQVLPIADKGLALVSPILVLLILSGLVRWIIPNGKSNFKELTDNIPSILAIVVLGSLCLLPVMGYEIPNELGNIALVVVGFYFGKLHTHTDKT